MIIITGSYFPDICGVGDFVTKLVKNSNFKYIKVTNYLEFFNMAKSTYFNNNILLEYPTQGYGWSLLPHLFTLFRWLTFKPIVVHLHEFKYQSLKNRLASYIFLFFTIYFLPFLVDNAITTFLPRYALAFFNTNLGLILSINNTN